MDRTKEHTTEQQRILSFCYGYGGLERGISRVIPIKPVAYVEIEAFQNFNLVSAMESGLVDKAPIWTDLKTFDGKPFHNRVHGIIGGYPCQGESLAGKRKLWNDDRFLWPYIERAIVDIRPLWCFFENVSGHITGSFPYVLDSLRNLGYSVESGLFTAEEVGATHKRERLFILAMANSSGNGDRGRPYKIPEKKQEVFERNENTESIKSNKELVNPKSGRSREMGNESSPRQGYGVAGRSRIFKSELADPPSKRNGESSKEYETRKFIQTSDQWPVGPGKQQHEWESLRSVEPGMGCTINGYNFRTELLRQFGNGVVSQTATKAFKMLLDKQIMNTRNL